MFRSFSRSFGKSIFRRLLFSYVVTVLLGLCAVGLLISLLTKAYITESRTTELLRQAKRVNLAIQSFAPPEAAFKEVLVFFDQSYDTRIWVYDINGKIVATSSKDEVNVGKSVDGEVVRKVIGGGEAVLKPLEGMPSSVLSVSVPWGRDNHVYGGILLHAPVTGLDETIAQLRESILWVTLLGVVISFTVSSYLSWSISRPIQQIDKAAAKIAAGDYSERIPIRSRDEIGELASTLNHMAEELGKVHLQKKKLEQIRHDFLANVSHELRTPLTAMRGFLEALQDDLIEESARGKYYDILYNETLHMNRLVDDITDLTRLENGEIVLSRTAVDVGALLQKTAFKFTKEALERGTQIVCMVEDSLPDAFADPNRLEQILNNLVKNAVKFTENGTISLGAVEEGDDILLSVTDTGIGISPEDLEMVWERFFKVDRGRSRKQQGSGLGLSIVRELVELHDGRISLDSEVGKGSRFEVRIPAVRRTE